MKVSRENYPAIAAAFELIETDNGGHLIGTVYPGTPINLKCFDIPDALEPRLPGIEQALGRIRSDPELFETFVIGEEGECELLIAMQGDLADAHQLLCEYFNGWTP